MTGTQRESSGAWLKKTLCKTDGAAFHDPIDCSTSCLTIPFWCPSGRHCARGRRRGSQEGV